MGPRGVLADLRDEIKFKFRREFALSKAKKQKIYAQITKHGFQVLKDGTWQEIFVKGVNIGAALPGKWFTEFPRDERVYLDWLEKIGQMQANSIRVILYCLRNFTGPYFTIILNIWRRPFGFSRKSGQKKIPRERII